MAFSLQARVVYPVDQPPIEHGVVTIDGDQIVAVGNDAAGGELIDLGSVALLPGLVNAHTHLEFSDLQQPLGRPGMSLPDWIRLVIAERRRDDRAANQALDRGVSESLGFGVTTIGDITTGPTSLGADVTHFHEVIGFSRARADSALAALAGRLSAGPGENRRIRHGISPHAPYTVSPRLAEELVSLARTRNFPIAMHLAESREELELLRDGTGPFRALLEERSMWDEGAIPRGSHPLDYLQILAKNLRSLVIHGNYLDDEELNFLAERKRMSLIYCPRTHAYFFHSPYPLGKALAAGVRVALGTDSRASNPDLDLLAEMRHAVQAHPATDPQLVLRMGTLAGADALGRSDEVGSITCGKLANLIAIPVAEDLKLDAAELLESLLSSEAPPSSVWLRGATMPLGAV